jgi:hypothetical protein
MPTEIRKILGNLIFYDDPEVLKAEYLSSLKKGSHFKKKLLKRYLEMLMNINWFLEKIYKYEIFFLHFYPKGKKIKKHTALEHHIHAYLEDMETLKNRLRAYVGSLKNDLQPIATNKKDIADELDRILKEIDKAFDQISKNRGPHRHSGDRFRDIDVMNLENASYFLDNKDFRKRLTKYGLKKMRKQKIESFNKGKHHWSQQASKNYEQVFGLTETILKGTKESLYQLLDIEPLHEGII